MKKVILMAMALVSMTASANVEGFFGEYNLAEGQGCWGNIAIVAEVDGQVSLRRTDLPDYDHKGGYTVVKSHLNSSRRSNPILPVKGVDSVHLQNNKLVFSFEGRFSITEKLKESYSVRVINQEGDVEFALIQLSSFKKNNRSALCKYHKVR